MITLTLLEKAGNRLISLIRVRNMCPESRKYNTELSAMINLLKCMDIEVDIDFSKNPEENKMSILKLTLENETITRKA